MSDIVRIKPHHFIDILTYYGAGTTSFVPHPFGHAQHTVAAQILDHPGILLEMELGADDICAPCMHNVGGLCDDVIDISYRPQAPSAKREWNLLIDRRWCARLGIGQGDRFSARALAQRIRGGCSLSDRAGDITDIYREIAPGPTAERLRKLTKGIEQFLKGGT
jgi:hypothetical protein